MTTISANSTAVANDALYVYCVAGDASRIPASAVPVRAASDEAIPPSSRYSILGPIGLDGQVVYTLGSGPLRAVVHSCPAEPYQSQTPQVVEDWVVAHQNVVRQAGETFGTVLPMAFDMIVQPGPGATAAAMLEAWLVEKRERFERLLGKFAGKSEYGVQVFWDREMVATALVASDEPLRQLRDEILTKPKGMAHLLRQKLARAIRTAMEGRADALAKDLYTRIRQCVDDIHVDPLKKGDDGRQMLLNLSCLMAQGRGDLGQVLDEVQQTAGISVRFIGPWPAYSFVGG